MTVVETPGFLREAASSLSESEREELVAFVAPHPELGDIMPGTGGVRKLRWAAKGKGKRGGVRVIYCCHNESFPVFLLNVFSKSQPGCLTSCRLQRPIGLRLCRCARSACSTYC